MKIPVLLSIVFIVMKLFRVIDWSWWWVVSPIWITLAWAFSVVLFCGIFGFTLKKNDK